METLLAVPKEQIGNIEFTQSDVLSEPMDQAVRKYKLRRAMMLGNHYQGKVTIKFRDMMHQPHAVETTVWAVFENYISIKSGMTLPIRSIEDIEF